MLRGNLRFVNILEKLIRVDSCYMNYIHDILIANKLCEVDQRNVYHIDRLDRESKKDR